MKQKYEAPELEIIRFHVEDVLTASGLVDGGEGDGDSSDMGDILP